MNPASTKAGFGHKGEGGGKRGGLGSGALFHILNSSPGKKAPIYFLCLNSVIPMNTAIWVWLVGVSFLVFLRTSEGKRSGENGEEKVLRCFALGIDLVVIGDAGRRG